VEYTENLLLPLREYPVQKILAAYALYHATKPELVEPELYAILPEPEAEDEEELLWEFPHILWLSPGPGTVAEGYGF
jgi:hypothetical protein